MSEKTERKIAAWAGMLITIFFPLECCFAISGWMPGFCVCGSIAIGSLLVLTAPMFLMIAKDFWKEIR